MPNNRENSCDILYSLKIGPSVYHVFGRPMKNSKHCYQYFVGEHSKTRSKSAKPSKTSLPPIERSKSLRRSRSPTIRPKTTHHNRVTFDQISNTKQHEPYRKSTKSQTKKIKKLNEQKPKEEKNTSMNLPPKEEIIRLFDEQKRSLIQLLEQHTFSVVSPSTDIIKQILNEVLQSQSGLAIKDFENVLIETFQQELQKTFLKINDRSSIISLDTQTMSQLQDSLTQTLEKYTLSMKEDNHTTLNNLFLKQKQILLETMTQQQQITSNDFVRQALTSALGEHTSTSGTSALTSNSPKLEIHADLQRTRIDPGFRQQRDSIVANRYLRESIREWSTIDSIKILIERIQECGTNDFEYAWLLFIWIGENLHHDVQCQENSIEDILQNRIASTQGFVQFYQQCCSLLNIQCSIIEDLVKRNENFEQISHRWNSIIIDGYTYLIDVIWGTETDQNNKFQDFYFLMSPEEFIYSHYSKDDQLLQPSLTEEDFLNLPLMKSNYFRLNLHLLTPKQIFNQTNENIFKISLKTPVYVDIHASLLIKNLEYPSHLHTLCQRDLNQIDQINCFFAPPSNGFYEIIIYAKTNNEMKYQETIYMELNVTNLRHALTFPIRSPSFSANKCILIEPFRRVIRKNEHLVVHMKIPNAYLIRIKNGDEMLEPTTDEYHDEILKKEILVRGDVHICVRWNEHTDKMSTISIFHMI